MAILQKAEPVHHFEPENHEPVTQPVQSNQKIGRAIEPVQPGWIWPFWNLFRTSIFTYILHLIIIILGKQKRKKEKIKL